MPAQEFGESLAVEYVMVPFTPLNWRARPITNLKARDVRLKVDGVLVATDLFEKSQNAPVSFSILVDGSGSMGLAGKMEAARTAVDTLLARSKPGDDFSVHVFSDEEAREVVPFTQDKEAVRRAVREIRPWGKTAFFDAIAAMPERSRRGRNPVRAIILLSDAIDNFSRRSKSQVMQILQDVQVPLYPISVRKQVVQRRRRRSEAIREELADQQLLEEVARLTGGQVFYGEKIPDVMKAIDQLETNLRTQYLVGFSPTGRGAVKYRRISLEIGRRTRVVRVRAGYRGTEPPVPAPTTRTRSKWRERK